MKKADLPQPAPLAALSHEFRTPLNAVLGMARLLEGTRLTAEQRAYVDALKTSGDHLLSLVNDVLDLAKLDAGALTLNPASMDVGVLLQSVAEMLSPRAQEKGLEIAWAVPPGVPPLMADEGRLRQVLFNLAGNAVKYTEKGGVILSCDVRMTGSKARLRLTVRDTGPGISAEQQAQIFEAFNQADNSGRADSTGLGLAIVRRLAEAHAGQAGVISEPGDGAEFWFEAEFEPAGRAAEIQPLKGVQMVVASPSLIVRMAAARQAEAAGAQVISCLTREEAAQRAPKDAVILVDQAFAGGRRRVAPIAGHTCIVLLPADFRRRMSVSRQGGFDGYLIKPLRQSSLTHRVLAALGRDVSDTAAEADERARELAAKGARVLLVEDNPVNALLARKLLEREGCVVDLAGSAEEAQIAVIAGRYDLILMDRRLPGMDGAEGARQLRKAGVTAPIVALTADAFEEDRQACLAAGMDDFLVKPLDPHALHGLLARVLSGGWTKPSDNAKLAS